ncbi:MAG: 50S ribosomal protein L4, partial [Sphingomonadaceae bacterium]
MKVKVQNLGGKKSADIELDDKVFGLEPRADILHRVVTWQLEKRRAPARAAPERREEAGPRRKYRRQEGGGPPPPCDHRAPLIRGRR